MKNLLRKVVKCLLYLGTALVILLAVAVGLFRLFLPKLPEYQEEIKDWADAAIGMQVEFSDMDARWRLRGPELNFYDAELVSRDNTATVLNAEEVRVGVGLMRLLVDRELVADRILIRDTSIYVDRDADGTWRVQGLALDALADSRMASSADAGPLTVVGEDIRIRFAGPGQRSGGGRPRRYGRVSAATRCSTGSRHPSCCRIPSAIVSRSLRASVLPRLPQGRPGRFS